MASTTPAAQRQWPVRLLSESITEKIKFLAHLTKICQSLRLCWLSIARFRELKTFHKNIKPVVFIDNDPLRPCADI